ncbi:MAG TPA: LamG-like jellyroll fold domain-containing protein [Candidatus Krumholzibacteria bacterium]
MGRRLCCAFATLIAVCAIAGAGIVHAQSGVQFDGTNDYITFGTASGLGASTFTLELWFYRSGTGATVSTGTGGVTAIPLITKGRGEGDGSNLDMNFFLGIRGSDNLLCADYEEGTGQTSPGLNHPAVGVTPIRNNTWYHAAATFDGTTWRLYLNGNLETTLAVGASRLPQSVSIQHAGIATAMTSTGVAAGFFAGVIDEARVWNVARTTQEINDTMFAGLTSGTGLLGRWGLDENTGTTATNSVGGGVNGTLTNGPAWTTGSPFELANSLKLGSNTAAYVTFGDPAELDVAQFTIETWFRRDGAGASASTGSGGVTAIPLVTHGGAEQEVSNIDMNYYLGIRASDNVLCADFEEGAGGSSPSLNHPVAGTTPIATGAWYHAAATYDGTTWRLYLNGALEATLAVGQPVASASTQHAGLGVMLNSTGAAQGHFDGALDETRVWNYARTGAEIAADINAQINAAVPGLVARWALNEGAGTAVKGSAGTVVNGTIQASGWSWDAPAPFNAGPPTPPAAPDNLVATATTFHRIDLTWVDNSNNETAFEIERSLDGVVFSPLGSTTPNTTVYADKTAQTMTTYWYQVRATNNSGPSGWSNTASTTTPPETDHAIDFGGTNGYVTFGDPSQLDLAQFTVETWFRRDGAGVTANTGTGGAQAIPLVTKGVGEAEASNVDMNYFLGIRGTDNVIIADFEEGPAGASPGQNHLVAGTTPITNGVWHHVAASYDGSTWNIYLDGVLEATLAVGQPVQSASIQHAALATAINSTGVNQGYFDGILDEVRIWNYARSLGQIRSAINAPIAIATPGLVARWSLNEGAANDVAGSAGTVVTGTIVNANWAWTTETAPYNIVVNDPPSVALDSPADNAVGVPLSPVLDVTVSDPEADSVTVSFYGRTQSPVDPTPFSLIILPDTQYYTSEQNGGQAAMMNSQMQWIVNNLDTRNIAWVDQVGDCTDHGDTYQVEWTRAVAATNLIENPLTTLLPEGVPYSITVGNHDQLPNGDATGTTNYYNQYYGVSHFSGRDYYGGHYGSNNDNHYSLFSANGLDFIAISVEYDTSPDAAVLEWADSLLAAHPNRWGMVSAHNLCNAGLQASWSTQGSTTYTALRDNPNLFLMVCGHVPGEGRRSDTYQGRTVHTVMADYQGRTNGGNGFLRIMTFYPAENVIRVKTYSPWLGQYEADADSSSQFTLPVALTATTSWQLLGTTKVASGEHATMAWPGLSAYGDYEWYAHVDDGNSNVDGPVWSFTTGSAAPSIALTRPNGGESFVAGIVESIEWNAADDFGVTSVDILVSRTGANGAYQTIASGEPNDGLFDWTVTGPDCDDAFIKVVAHDAESNAAFDISDASFSVATPTGVDDRVPSAFGLGMLSANPFSDTGVFDVALKHDARVKLTVYDVAGRRVTELVNDSMPAGRHEVRWNGDSDRGRVASGVYFVRMEAAGLTFTKRVVLIR